MTTKQMRAEIMYQKSVAPFIQMERTGIITRDDLRVIVAILAERYRPVFVHYLG